MTDHPIFTSFSLLLLLILSLKPAEADPPFSSSWSSLKMASLDLKNSKFPEALHTLENLQNDPGWDFWKKVLLAETYLKLKAPHKALTLIETIPPLTDLKQNPNQDFFLNLHRQALQIQKTALEKMEKPTQAVDQMIWALSSESDHHQFPSAGISPRITRIHFLHGRGKLEELASLATPSEIAGSPLSLSERCQALTELGDGLRTAKKMPEARNAYSQGVSLGCPDDLLIRALYWKAKLSWKLNRTDEAIETYENLIKKFPNHRLTDDGYYALWKIYVEKKLFVKADKAKDELIAYGKGDMRAGLLWEEGFDQFKKGNFKKALSLFDLIISAPPSEDESTPQALYWKARSLEKMTAKKTSETPSGEAHQIYGRIRSDFPFSFYALLSASRLGISHQTPSLTIPNPSIPADSFSQEIMITVDELNQKGKNQEALDLLDYYSQVQPSQAKQNKVLMAKKWMENGDYNQTLRLAFDHFGVGPSEGVGKKNDPMTFALYPLAFPREIKKGAARTSLPAGFLLGIMREESLFKDTIESWAGAVGLMQVMPATAHQQAKFVNLTSYSPESLTDPETNILLGSSYFHRMVQLYHDNIPLAVMAYNAGPGNVNKWKRGNGNLPLDEFIEEIPFTETRGYVKRVMRSMQVYGKLLGEKEFKQSFFSMKIN